MFLFSVTSWSSTTGFVSDEIRSHLLAADRQNPPLAVDRDRIAILDHLDEDSDDKADSKDAGHVQSRHREGDRNAETRKVDLQQVLRIVVCKLLDMLNDVC